MSNFFQISVASKSPKYLLNKVNLRFLATFQNFLERSTKVMWPPKRKHRFCQRHFNLIINLNLILNFYLLSSSFTKMVGTRSQLENLWKETLIEELITVDDISSKLSDLSNRFDDVLRRFEVASSDLAIARDCKDY